MRNKIMPLDPSKYDKFDILDTTTDGKLTVIELQTALINHRFTKKTIADGLCIGLPGTHFQCDRHKLEYLRYGSPESKQWFVDISSCVTNVQTRWAKKNNFKGKIINDNLFDVIYDCFDHNRKISIIDFDGVGYVEPEHLKLIWDSGLNNVKVLILVFTARGCAKPPIFLERARRKYGLGPKDCLEKQNRYSRPPTKFPMAAIQEALIRNAAYKAGYECWNDVYKGHGNPMMSFVLLKR